MPAELTEEDVFQAWNDDVATRKRPELDEAPLLEAAASAVAVSSASQRPKSGFSTPSTPVEAQKGSGYATPRQSNVEIRQPQLVFPASHYDGWKPPMPPTLEDELVEELLSEDCDTEYQMVSVSNFRMYRPPAPDRKFANYEGEMEPLHVVSAKRSCDSLLFDATISTSRGEKYVQGVPFQTLAIDAYNPDLPTAAGRISIQSMSASDTRLWYLLDGSPSPEYERYHRAFLWVADLAKHAVDYMSENDNVTLSDFQRNFYVWITKRHGRQGPRAGPNHFEAWLAQFQGKDFRSAIVAYAEFIWKECSSVNDTLCREPLWRDINFIPDKTSPPEEQQTIVTPFVFRNFAHMPFHKHLAIKSPTALLERHDTARKHKMGFSDANAHAVTKSQTQTDLKANAQSKVSTADLKIKEGDCVAIEPDEETRWRDGAEMWYGYVQGVQGERCKILWLYEPQQTILSERKPSGEKETVRYPYPNELFLSDHCNCRSAPTWKKDIVRKVAVNFLYGPTANSRKPGEYFARHKYNRNEHSFLSLKEADFRCACKKGNSLMDESMLKYCCGDVVLVRPGRLTDSDVDSQDDVEDDVDSEEESQHRISRQSGQELLEPVAVVKFIPKRSTISVRKLLRRNRDLKDVKARPNELVWTNEIHQVQVGAISDSHPRCHVRWYHEDQITANKIPAPYNRDGCANYWYLCSHIVNHNGDEYWERLDAPPPGLNQGWDPLQESARSLKGLDVFCGGGNFGRGLAEGGAVEMTHAIDWSRNAVASYRTNEPRGKEASLYCGSVNDYLAQAIQGHKNHQKYASNNDIDFIAAGSPCQGFSRLNENKSSEQSLRNISMVASVAAFIDFYRPKYALLENVVTMAHSDVFPQLLCCLVGMGYQVSTSMVDAWSHGSPQARSRLFIYISAPGLAHQQPPALTHSHPPQYNSRARALGRSHANDGKFGERDFTPTPFKFASAAEAMDDLPWIGDGRVQTCISHPSHRNLQVETVRYRQLISHIPINPPGSSAMSAIGSGAMPEPVKDWYLTKRSDLKSYKGSNAYRRVVGDELTNARRAQGFPDHEVIIGSPLEQWKIVGNSVARTVALALGATLREAWLSSSEQHEDPRTCTPVSLVESCASPISTVESATGQRKASPRPRSTTPICRQTVESTLSITQSSTSRETRKTRYTQDTLELSQKTTTRTVMSVPSSSSTESAVKLEESEKMAEIVDLSSESETEEHSAGETQSTTTTSSGPPGSRETLIIDLSEDTTDSECSAAPKRKSRSSSSELSHDATAKRPKKEPEPTVIDLADLTDESSE
ncbi:uncharacterized protein J3D65DRAFT_670486 [Phyllosticta citribraziliensis]|uniref:DNA (cytosine-5-)-methyltransferase n=1 Tax=Phyllosticta citribraziliensis TaxID=989973 RepID=A0ABR1LHT9_9PEZI